MSRLESLPPDEQRRLLALAALAAKARAQHAAEAAPAERAFASPEHEQFYDSEAPEVVASGWMGAGKSHILCQKAYDLALRYPGSELGLFRKVQASLVATTERTFWQDVVDPRFVIDRNRSEHWVDVGLGPTCRSRIWFAGLEADPVTGVPSKVGSLNLDWAGVDEAVELTPGDWIMLGGRLRRTAMPYRQLAAATNPAGPGHWLKVRFTPPSATREWITITENRFLPPDYRERLASLGDGVHAQRLGQGLWVAAEGTIWTLPAAQVCRPLETDWKHVYAGVDWGFQHAFAAEVVAASGSGHLAVIAEVYARRRTLDDIIPALLDLQARYEVETFAADPSEPAYIEQCRAAGVRIRKATNDVLPGITAVTAAIAAGMTVDPACTGLLAELPAYTWRPERGSGETSDAPVKANDDACDALRYGVMAHRLPTGTWFLPYLQGLLAKGAAERERARDLGVPACGAQFRTPIPSIAICGRPAGHTGRCAE